MDTYLERYKPTLPDLFNDFSIDDDLPEAEKAFKANEMLLVAKRNNESLFLVIGLLLKKIRDEELYLKLDYESFSQYLASEDVSYSRESAYLFIRSYEYLIQHLKLNPDSVGKMNIGRINNMIPVLKKVEEEQGIEEAIRMIGDFQSLRHGDFIQAIQETKKNAKPDLYFSQELKKWIVTYWEDTTVLHSKGVLVKEGRTCVKKPHLLSGKKLTQALDSVVREILHKKYPHPTCFVCGKKIDWFHPKKNPYGMQVGHYISRAVYLRWDFKNLECQCSSCNYNHENNTLPFTDKIIEHYGLERFNYLMKMYKMYHNSGIKLTTANKREILVKLQKLLLDTTNSS